LVESQGPSELVAPALDLVTYTVERRRAVERTQPGPGVGGPARGLDRAPRIRPVSGGHLADRLARHRRLGREGLARRGADPLSRDEHLERPASPQARSGAGRRT